MKELKLLDDVLRHLRDHAVKNTMDNPDVFNGIGKLTSMEMRDKLSAMKKLERDIYVDVIKGDKETGADIDKYLISYEGLIFINKGGYEKQRVREVWRHILDKTSVCVIIVGSLFAIYYSLHEIFCH